MKGTLAGNTEYEVQFSNINGSEEDRFSMKNEDT